MATTRTAERFHEAADNCRPFKSHRYDVFGLKIDRSVTLFGRGPLNAWICLEADPSVISYCERPLAVTDTKLKRVVDFWVRRAGGEELWILWPKNEVEAGTDPHAVMPAFITWAATKNFSVRFVNQVEFVDQSMFLDNWGRIIRELSANRRFVLPSTVARVGKCVTTPHQLGALITLFPDEDPTIVRASAYSLLHSGTLRCVDITTHPLGPASVLEVA